MAVPVRGICCVVLGDALRLLSVRVTVPVTGPDASGVNSTLILQDWPGKSEKVVVQSPEESPKVKLLGERTIPGETAPSGVAPLPSLRIVTDWAALEMPSP
jgi:hypothetical protein